ncbi:MAG: DUF1501 domain-containing protein [Planctomycetota bacterium]|nr:DUF1501 domain-containing protein [Planctomycetota bacterium]
MTHSQQLLDRRQWLQRSAILGAGSGLGGTALASLLADQSTPHFAARAKHVIYIHMVGAPSTLDLFDLKPELQRRQGQKCPDEFFKGKKLAFIRSHPKLLGTATDRRYAFKKCGESGMEISNLLPHLQTCVDDIALIRSLRTEEFNHAPAQMFLQTGFGQFGRPSLGAWASYGLGSLNQDLPAFVAMVTGQYPGAGNSVFGSGFLPSRHQGIEFRSKGDAVLFLSNPKGIDREHRRRIVDSIKAMDEMHLADVGDPEIATRIQQYELAYRMQASVPELMDIKQEPPAIHAMYGTRPGQTSFANNCLQARRLVERGVRFVQLFDQGWDHHGSIFTRLPVKCQQVDRPIAALIADLKMRGLLDQTLVVWASEFGRTPMAQGSNGQGLATKAGRDHHREAYSVWMAGGGSKGGTVYGATDELGYSAVDKPFNVHDFNATILHLLGIDHEKLLYRFQGRDFRLTDVQGVVPGELIA